MRIKTKTFEKHQQYVIVDFVAVYCTFLECQVSSTASKFQIKF